MGKIKKVSDKKEKISKTIKKKPKQKKLSKKFKEESNKEKVKSASYLNKINYDQVLGGVEAFLKYDKTVISKDLFEEEKTILLQIECIKIPFGPNLRLRFPVKHPLVTDQSEVCLIVPDLKKGRNVDHEPTIEHYEQLLKSKGVTCVKRILPFRQLKVEYETFELKRRLHAFFDYFLVDGKISGHVSHFLGSTFYNSSKMPIPIHLNSNSLNETINYALKKVLLNLRCVGNVYSVPVGHNKMTSKMILDNIKSVVDCLHLYFPGGFDNIRMLSLKMQNSLAFPLYLTLKSSNVVAIPMVEQKRPKHYEIVTGELSTMLNHNVIVHPTGEVEVIREGKTPKLNKSDPLPTGNVESCKFPIVIKKEEPDD